MDCPDCDDAAKLAYSDATTPGFFSAKCPKHREALCGTCGKPLPIVNGKACDLWHFCWKQLAGGRQIIINYDEGRGGGGYTIIEGDCYADGLGFDEMLGQVVNLLHPKVARARYQMLNFEEWKRLHPWHYPDAPKPEEKENA